mmetsp:Transcript_27602/g.70314  ORF Transcript_27602/g.70314 Transcript_27602/m.70314 type:complete len:507 (-) Transcript_27602:826-2346(-)
MGYVSAAGLVLLLVICASAAANQNDARGASRRVQQVGGSNRGQGAPMLRDVHGSSMGSRVMGGGPSAGRRMLSLLLPGMFNQTLTSVNRTIGGTANGTANGTADNMRVHYPCTYGTERSAFGGYCMVNQSWAFAVSTSNSFTQLPVIDARHRNLSAACERHLPLTMLGSATHTNTTAIKACLADTANLCDIGVALNEADLSDEFRLTCTTSYTWNNTIPSPTCPGSLYDDIYGCFMRSSGINSACEWLDIGRYQDYNEGKCVSRWGYFMGYFEQEGYEAKWIKGAGGRSYQDLVGFNRWGLCVPRALTETALLGDDWLNGKWPNLLQAGSPADILATYQKDIDATMTAAEFFGNCPQGLRQQELATKSQLCASVNNPTWGLMVPAAPGNSSSRIENATLFNACLAMRAPNLNGTNSTSNGAQQEIPMCHTWRLRFTTPVTTPGTNITRNVFYTKEAKCTLSPYLENLLTYADNEVVSAAYQACYRADAGWNRTACGNTTVTQKLKR